MKYYLPSGLCVVILTLCPFGLSAPVKVAADKIGAFSFEQVLEHLGAKMEARLTFEEHQDYIRHFDLVDTNRDGRHSTEEYIENGFYLNAMARRGIFNAADENDDQFVTKDEYVLNRIITDEAKTIMQAMDDDRDGLISKKEFLNHTKPDLKEPLAKDVFEALDMNRNGSLMIPEYLRVWGIWARTNKLPAKARLAALRESELDDYWAEVSRSVREGDYDGYAATCHPEGVLVSGSSQSSNPLKRALARWRQGFLDTKSGKMKASVDFRFGNRVGDETTAHETGIFRYLAEVDGEKTVSLIHFEALLTKKNNHRWLILMENQKSPATQAEWEALASIQSSDGSLP